MKAKYIQPVTEVINLHVSEDITWGLRGQYSQTKNHTANSGFYEDSEEENNNSFFDE